MKQTERQTQRQKAGSELTGAEVGQGATADSDGGFGELGKEYLLLHGAMSHTSVKFQMSLSCALSTAILCDMDSLSVEK